MGVNRGNVEAMMPDIAGLVKSRARESGQPVKLVGWSLGGVLAREAARDEPDSVAQVITLGSPVVGGPRYTATARFYENQGADLEAIERAVEARNAVPIEAPITSIYSKNDGVVAWRACLDTVSPTWNTWRSRRATSAWVFRRQYSAPWQSHSPRVTEPGCVGSQQTPAGPLLVPQRPAPGRQPGPGGGRGSRPPALRLLPVYFSSLVQPHGRR